MSIQCYQMTESDILQKFHFSYLHLLFYRHIGLRRFLRFLTSDIQVRFQHLSGGKVFTFLSVPIW